MPISQLEPDEIRGTVMLMVDESLTEEEKERIREEANEALQPILDRVISMGQTPLSATENRALQTELADAVRNIPGVKQVQVRPLLSGQASVRMKMTINMDTGEVEIETESVTNTSPKGPDFTGSSDVIRVSRQR